MIVLCHIMTQKEIKKIVDVKQKNSADVALRAYVIQSTQYMRSLDLRLQQLESRKSLSNWLYDKLIVKIKTLYKGANAALKLKLHVKIV
jgi:hypothetical protein